MQHVTAGRGGEFMRDVNLGGRVTQAFAALLTRRNNTGRGQELKTAGLSTAHACIRMQLAREGGDIFPRSLNPGDVSENKNNPATLLLLLLLIVCRRKAEARMKPA
jgi:hypothetical protein